jgi:alkylated DNA repair dioxygenase AlkB
MFQPGMFQSLQGPPGFIYQPDFITPEEEQILLREVSAIPLKTYEYKGYESKRQVKSWTSSYGYPLFLFPILKRVAEFAKVKIETIRHAMITEYSPGTAIGWHRDQPPFIKIIGISLGSPAHFRFRRKNWSDKNGKWNHLKVVAEPRSLYVMAGASRSDWQHSIPPVPALRYSLTMRTVE